MQKDKNSIRKKNKQSGQSLTEYLILVALIAISSIGIIRILGQTTRAQLANITNALQGNHSVKIKSDNVEETHYNTNDLSNFMKNSSNKNDQK
jgi:Tfp pilus assembly protein PilV